MRAGRLAKRPRPKDLGFHPLLIRSTFRTLNRGCDCVKALIWVSIPSSSGQPSGQDPLGVGAHNPLVSIPSSSGQPSGRDHVLGEGRRLEESPSPLHRVNLRDETRARSDAGVRFFVSIPSSSGQPSGQFCFHNRIGHLRAWSPSPLHRVNLRDTPQPHPPGAGDLRLHPLFIGSTFGTGVAEAQDGCRVEVSIPSSSGQPSGRKVKSRGVTPVK